MLRKAAQYKARQSNVQQPDEKRNGAKATIAIGAFLVLNDTEGLFYTFYKLLMLIVNVSQLDFPRVCLRNFRRYEIVFLQFLLHLYPRGCILAVSSALR